MRFENKFISRLIAFGFVLALFTLLAFTIFGEAEEYSYFENRRLAEMPDMSTETVLSGEYFSDIEQYLADHAAARLDLVELNTRLGLKLKKPVVNNVVVQEDCLLPFLKFEDEPDPDVIETKAETVTKNLSSHRDRAEAYGGHFCYVAVPCQYVCREDSYPDFLENRASYTDASSKSFFGKLDEAGVEYIDMYESYLALSDEEKDQFISSKDNHFSIFGAYDTYLKMVEKINSDWDGDVPVLGEGDFEVEKIENRYLGSRGRMLFDLWNNDESLYIIKPKEDIPFVRYNGEKEGTATVYSIPKDPNAFATYSVYMGGDFPRTTIDTGRRELPSILIYGDSFTNAVESIAWYSFDRMESADLRYYKDKTIDELIDELQPDYVFCIRDYEQLIESSSNGG